MWKIIRKHKFWHTHVNGRFAVVCEYCKVERLSLPYPIGYRWLLNGNLLIKKPKCITRQIKTNGTEL